MAWLKKNELQGLYQVLLLLLLLLLCISPTSTVHSYSLYAYVGTSTFKKWAPLPPRKSHTKITKTFITPSVHRVSTLNPGHVQENNFTNTSHEGFLWKIIDAKKLLSIWSSLVLVLVVSTILINSFFFIFIIRKKRTEYRINMSTCQNKHHKIGNIATQNQTLYGWKVWPFFRGFLSSPLL